MPVSKDKPLKLSDREADQRQTSPQTKIGFIRDSIEVLTLVFRYLEPANIAKNLEKIPVDIPQIERQVDGDVNLTDEAIWLEFDGDKPYIGTLLRKDGTLIGVSRTNHSDHLTIYQISDEMLMDRIQVHDDTCQIMLMADNLLKASIDKIRKAELALITAHANLAFNILLIRNLSNPR